MLRWLNISFTQSRKMNEKQISECTYISQKTVFHTPSLLHQPRWAEICYFWFSYWIAFCLLLQKSLLDMMHSQKCMLGVLTSELALGSSERADVGLCLCLTCNINELMCVHVLVKLSLDCVLRDGGIWHSCANRKSCNLLSLPSSETSQMWHESQCQHLVSGYSWFCDSGPTQVASWQKWKLINDELHPVFKRSLASYFILFGGLWAVPTSIASSKYVKWS